jgi:hypothetical protein
MKIVFSIGYIEITQVGYKLFKKYIIGNGQKLYVDQYVVFLPLDILYPH